MYAVKLPVNVPPAGTPGGPPPVEARRLFLGMPSEVRQVYLGLNHHPEDIPKVIAEMTADWKKRQEAKKR
jgi:hypothetical protein